MAVNSLKALNNSPEGKGVTRKGDLISVAPELLLEEDGFNTRGAFMPDYWEREEVKMGIRLLADAYKRGDFVPPIIVKVIDGRVLVRDGHRRRRGLLLAISEGAEIKKVAVVEHRGDEAAQSLLIATSSDGVPLSPLDRAVLYGRFSNWGWTDREIAIRVGRSVEHVRVGLVMLQEFPLELKTLIQSNGVAAHYAMELFREHGGQKTLQLLLQAKKEQESLKSDDSGKSADLPEKPIKITKKMVQKKPVLGKKIVTAMHASMLSITSRLDDLKKDGELDSYVLVLTQAEVESLYELREKLAQSATENDSGKTPGQLSLLDSSESAS